MLTTISIYTENMSKEEMFTFAHQLMSKLEEIKKIEKVHIVKVDPDLEKDKGLSEWDKLGLIK